LWAATVFVIFLFCADWLSGGALRHVVRGAAETVSRPVFAVAHGIASSGFFSSRASLAAQNDALSQQIAQLQERAAYDAVLQSENDQLRSLSHLAQTPHGLTAPVISSVIASPYGTFLIGAGATDGVRAGDAVMSAQASGEGGFVIGEVSDVGAHTATVREVLAADAAVNIIVSGSPATLQGSGGGNGHLSLPRGARVAEGDAVIAPQLGGRAIGIVGSVASSSASAKEDVYVRVPVNLGALQFVYVVTS
jgi:cell shape-determining protein MreC